MFKKILVPTDGSTLSDLAVTKAIAFAKSINAAVYGFHASRDYAMPVHGVDIYSAEQFREFSEQEARHSCASIAGESVHAGVCRRTGCTVSFRHYRAIIDAANEQGCDLIFMASHGRRGLSGLLLGSETQKVLTHCNIPVLVFRDENSERRFRQALEETNDFRT